VSGAQEVRDRVDALREDVGAHAGLVVQERALVRIGRGGVHAWPEIDEDALVRVLALDHGGRRIGAEARRVNQVVLRQDAHRARPLDGGQRLVERTADRIVVSDEAGRLAGAQEEVRERVGAILESAGLARGCGNRHCDIITRASTDYIEDHLMRCLAMLLCVAATALGAQQPEPPPDSTRAVTESMPTPPPPPTLEQKRFLAGLRTATRGIAQLKDGMSRVARAGTRDSATQRRAGRFLAGLCGSSRGFLKRGRPQMTPTVYEDSVQLKARRLVTQVDSMIKYTTSCEDSAAATPTSTAVGLGKRMKSYDAALRDFRVAIGLPVKDDTTKATKRP